MKTNYKLTTNSVKPCTKYDCITVVSAIDYTKIAVYTYKLAFVKSKVFHSVKSSDHKPLYSASVKGKVNHQRQLLREILY